MDDCMLYFILFRSLNTWCNALWKFSWPTSFSTFAPCSILHIHQRGWKMKIIILEWRCKHVTLSPFTHWYLIMYVASQVCGSYSSLSSKSLIRIISLLSIFIDFLSILPLLILESWELLLRLNQRFPSLTIRSNKLTLLHPRWRLLNSSCRRKLHINLSLKFSSTLLVCSSSPTLVIFCPIHMLFL